MKNILIYGTFDFFHVGHQKLLERAKQYGTKLYIGVCTDEFNLIKGKKAYYSYEERVEKLKDYEGVIEIFPQSSFEQKLEDIKKYDIHYLISGDDWEGNNDHLKEYCEVIYLPRTRGISSTQIRENLKSEEEELTLKEQQIVLTKLMKEIHQICTDNKIEYWLSAGSLLGAVRHKGFIPWDDDMDIAMSREDYERFKKIVYEKEKSDLFFLTYETDENYKRENGGPLMKICDTRYIAIEEDDYNRGIFIDVNPYDKFSQNRIFRTFQKIPKFLLKIKRKSNEKFSSSLLKNLKILICKPLTFVSYESIYSIDKIWKRFINRKNDIIYSHPNENSFECEIYEKDLYPLRKVKFEDEEFYIPNIPDKYLSNKYGNYLELPPENKRKNHQLKCYKRKTL